MKLYAYRLTFHRKEGTTTKVVWFDRRVDDDDVFLLAEPEYLGFVEVQV